jgi:hypothetical protein
VSTSVEEHLFDARVGQELEGIFDKRSVGQGEEAL